jgi:undecaprenyl-diphosphatase
MPLLHIVILALVQGITEFLPISSSGHLVLVHHILQAGSEITDLTMDIAVHIGTLFAVLLYFRRDLCSMACKYVKRAKQKPPLLLYIIIGSMPVVIAGFALYILSPLWMRSLHVTAWCTLIFALLLYVADIKGRAERTLDHMTLRDALYIGMMQVLALIPGTSRSGITMTAARFLGFSRVEAARFSMFLAIVAISGAGTLSSLALLDSNDFSLGFDVLVAVILSFASSLAAIALLMKWLEKSSFKPFVIYRVALGLLLLGLLYSGVLT